MHFALDEDSNPGHGQLESEDDVSDAKDTVGQGASQLAHSVMAMRKPVTLQYCPDYPPIYLTRILRREAALKPMPFQSVGSPPHVIPMVNTRLPSG